MSENIQITGGGQVTIDRHPDHCSICHCEVTPNMSLAKYGGKQYPRTVEIVYICPNAKCGQFFVGDFLHKSNVSQHLFKHATRRAITAHIYGIRQGNFEKLL